MYVIDDLGYEAVLGRDFLEENGAVIDFRDRTLQLTDSTPLECLPTTQVVRAVTTYVKPPQAETILPAKVEQETIIGGTGLIEPSPQLIQKYCTQGAAILANPTADGDVPFRVIIPTAKPVVINEGTTLGAFTSMEGISCIHEHDSTPVSKDSQPQDDAASHVDLSNSKVTADQQQALKYLLNKYRDVFALTPDEQEGTGIIKYTTDTGYSAPIRSRPYRIPEAKKATVNSTPFVWDENCQAAFDRLKQALTEAPILAYPDFTLPFDLYVDASDEGIGMVLGQDKKEKSA